MTADDDEYEEGVYGATIFDGREVVARFDRAEDAIACLPAIARILNLPLRLETHDARTTCRIPERVVVYGSEFFYRP